MRKVIKIGIMSFEDYKQRTMDIVSGKYRPKKGEPKIWFESIQSLGQVLSSQNQELLRVILEHNPGSLKELSELTGRKVSNLSRTLHTMQNVGIVELKRNRRSVMPVVLATDFRVEFGISPDSAAER
jgi:predicted transcriptional regulator